MRVSATAMTSAAGIGVFLIGSIDLMRWIFFPQPSSVALYLSKKGGKRHALTLCEPGVRSSFRPWAWTVLPVPPEFAAVCVGAQFTLGPASLAV